MTLEATLSGRRWRIERSPSWQRPKKRGTGVTTEQASVHLAERVDGTWVTRSTRLDETGHLVTRLVGMNLPQFCQVAMLPQGRFQAFLRARSEERHTLLQQVFRTGRFDQVERWLREHRLAVRRASEEHASAVSGARQPAQRDGRATRPRPRHRARRAALLVGGGARRRPRRGLRRGDRQCRRRRRGHPRRARPRRRRAQLRLLQEAHADAAARVAGHDAAAHAAARRRLDRAQRAATLTGLDHALAQAETAREVAHRDAGRALAAWTALAGPHDPVA